MEGGGGTKREQVWRLVIAGGGEYCRKSVILDLEVDMIRRSKLVTPELGVLNLMEGVSVCRARRQKGEQGRGERTGMVR